MHHAKTEKKMSALTTAWRGQLDMKHTEHVMPDDGMYA